jgi:hypothetical protein
LIITLVFKKNADFFAENWEKSPKIVIITSTPGHPAFDHLRLFSGRPFTYVFKLNLTSADHNLCRSTYFHTKAGANPTTSSYDASAVKIYNSTDSLAAFGKQKHFLLL